MKCAKIHPNLGAFVLGGLEPEEATEIRHHLALCSGCREELEELEKVNRALGAAPPSVDPPGHLKDEILSRVRDEKLSSSEEELSSSKNLRFILPVVAAAAFVATVALGVFFVQTEPAVTSIALNPTPEVRDEMNAEGEDYWGVAELHPQPSGNQLVELKLNNLDKPSPGNFYEMWFVSGENHISAGAFTSVGSGETRVWLTAPPEALDYRTLLVTEEPMAEEPNSDKEVILTGEVP
jgi:Anti-sigma-K factor rskA/Putative zinc-finger